MTIVGQKIEVVAEIGVNHDGSLDRALELVDLAVECGADAVKTQLSVPEKETSYFHARGHGEMIRKLMLSHDEMMTLAAYCRNGGIEFLCTPAEEESLDWLVAEGLIKRIKLASDAVNCLRFLKHVAKQAMPTILSTGMADGDEVNDAFHTLRMNLMREEITLLHCTSLYPCAAADANLAAIQALMPLGSPVGWSDHTTSSSLAVAAVALGAVMIEKHLTYDTSASGPDHAASLNPGAFREMVANIRELEQAMGDGIKRPRPAEMETAKVVRKSIVAAKPIKAGQRIGYHNLAVRRPGTGLPPTQMGRLNETLATRDYAEGEMIDG